MAISKGPIQSQNSNEEMGRIDISNLGTSSEMLEEDKFWEIVFESLENSGNQYEQEEMSVIRNSLLLTHYSLWVI